MVGGPAATGANGITTAVGAELAGTPGRGPGLTRLFVTTATQGWTDEQRRADPAAGLVYRHDTDTTGLPAAPFRPDPDWWQEVTA